MHRIPVHRRIEGFVILWEGSGCPRHLEKSGIDFPTRLFKIINRAGPHRKGLVQFSRCMSASATDDDFINRSIRVKFEPVRISPRIAKLFEIDSLREHGGLKRVEVANIGSARRVDFFYSSINLVTNGLEVRPG